MLFKNSTYLFQLVELLPDALVLNLQVIVLLFELLLLLQHHQPVLGRLDLLVRGLAKLPGEPLDLGSHPLGPRVEQPQSVGVAPLFHGHGGILGTIDQRTPAGLRHGGCWGVLRRCNLEGAAAQIRLYLNCMIVTVAFLVAVFGQVDDSVKFSATGEFVF